MNEAAAPNVAAHLTRVAIIGTGFAGLGMAIKLKQQGIHSFTVYEQADGVGGTWRDNTYPGAACDVQSHLYSFSFEPNPSWSSMYGKQAEILAYLERTTDRYGVRPHIRFNTRVQSARFDEASATWILELDDGTTARADVVVSATGGLSRPKYPDIEGIDAFEGQMFHSARWNHDCDLDGKRVAVIGTGASAIQIVPQLAKRVSRLHVFQRSAAWVMPKDDHAISEREQRAYALLPLLQKLHRYKLYWQLELRAAAFVMWPQVLERFQKQAEAYIARQVRDPELRAKLIPDYTLGCKRILLANDYYPALQKDNVEVITEGIERITPTGVTTGDGAHFEADVIVLCTGFQASEDVAPFPVTGLNGRDLSTEWRAGAEAYLGTAVSGFPNLFMLVGPNTGLGHSSMVFMIESQIAYVMSALRTLEAAGADYMDVRPDVQSRFNERLQDKLGKTVWASGCTSWYQTSDGKNTTLWPGFTVEFRARTRRVRAADYRLCRAGDAAAQRTSRPSASSHVSSVRASAKASS